SFVAVEQKVVNRHAPPRRVDVPVELPEGVSPAGASGQGIDGRDTGCLPESTWSASGPADARAPGDGIVPWAMSHRQPAAPLRYTRDWTAGTPSSDGERTDGDTYLQDYTELSGRGYSSAPAVPPRAALVPPARMETMSLREAA